MGGGRVNVGQIYGYAGQRVGFRPRQLDLPGRGGIDDRVVGRPLPQAADGCAPVAAVCQGVTRVEPIVGPQVDRIFGHIHVRQGIELIPRFCNRAEPCGGLPNFGQIYSRAGRSICGRLRQLDLPGAIDDRVVGLARFQAADGRAPAAAVPQGVTRVEPTIGPQVDRIVSHIHIRQGIERLLPVCSGTEHCLRRGQIDGGPGQRIGFRRRQPDLPGRGGIDDRVVGRPLLKAADSCAPAAAVPQGVTRVEPTIGPQVDRIVGKFHRCQGIEILPRLRDRGETLNQPCPGGNSGPGGVRNGVSRKRDQDGGRAGSGHPGREAQDVGIGEGGEGHRRAAQDR